MRTKACSFLIACLMHLSIICRAMPLSKVSSSVAMGAENMARLGALDSIEHGIEEAMRSSGAEQAQHTEQNSQSGNVDAQHDEKHAQEASQSQSDNLPSNEDTDVEDSVTKAENAASVYFNKEDYVKNMKNLRDAVGSIGSMLSEALDERKVELRQRLAIEREEAVIAKLKASQKEMTQNMTKELEKFVEDKMDKGLKNMRASLVGELNEVLQRRDNRMRLRGVRSDIPGDLFIMPTNTGTEGDARRPNERTVFHEDSKNPNAPPQGAVKLSFVAYLQTDDINANPSLLDARKTCAARRLKRALEKKLDVAAGQDDVFDVNILAPGVLSYFSTRYFKSFIEVSESDSGNPAGAQKIVQLEAARAYRSALPTAESGAERRTIGRALKNAKRDAVGEIRGETDRADAVQTAREHMQSVVDRVESDTEDRIVREESRKIQQQATKSAENVAEQSAMKSAVREATSSVADAADGLPTTASKREAIRSALRQSVQNVKDASNTKKVESMREEERQDALRDAMKSTKDPETKEKIRTEIANADSRAEGAIAGMPTLSAKRDAVRSIVQDAVKKVERESKREEERAAERARAKLNREAQKQAASEPGKAIEARVEVVVYDKSMVASIRELVAKCEPTSFGCASLLSRWKNARVKNCDGGLLGDSAEILALQIPRDSDIHQNIERRVISASDDDDDDDKVGSSSARGDEDDSTSMRMRRIISTVTGASDESVGDNENESEESTGLKLKISQNQERDSEMSWRTRSKATIPQSMCSNGTRQSPIDIIPENRGSIEGGSSYGSVSNVVAVSPNQLPRIRVTYPPLSKLHILNTGDGVLIQYPQELNGTATLETHVSLHPLSVDGDTTLRGEEPLTYRLRQLHFHTPAEHSISGHVADVELHLVHELVSDTRSAAPLLIVAVRFSRSDSPSPFLSTFIHSLPPRPESGDILTEGDVVHPSHLNLALALFGSADGTLSSSSYYTYRGSLTTDPCPEEVQWFVMRKAMPIADVQVKALEQAIGRKNSRPAQNSKWALGSLVVYEGTGL